MIRTALPLVVLAACASVGPHFDATRIDTLSLGVSTQADVRHALGDPHQTSRPLPHEPCAQRWHYAYAEAHASAGTPAVVVTLGFDADGRLCDVQHYRQAS
jgi:hypothetical protein